MLISKLVRNIVDALEDVIYYAMTLICCSIIRKDETSLQNTFTNDERKEPGKLLN